jgi:hypothetical protein
VCLQVTVSDVADAAVAVLANPAPHAGRTYNVAGPMYTHRELAAAFSSTLGKPVEYVQVPFEAAKKSFVDKGFPEWQVRCGLSIARCCLSLSIAVALSPSPLPCPWSWSCVSVRCLRALLLLLLSCADRCTCVRWHRCCDQAEGAMELYRAVNAGSYGYSSLDFVRLTGKEPQSIAQWVQSVKSGFQ